MRNCILYLSLIFLILNSSCESEPNFVIRDDGGHLVMFSFLTADSVFSVHLSRSVGHSSVDDFERIYDGFIAVYKNDARIDTFHYSYRDLWQQRPQIKINTHDKFMIKAYDERDNMIYGETLIPEIVPIIRLDTMLVTAVNNEGIVQRSLECKVVFLDPPDEDNYYQLVVEELNYDNDGNILMQQFVNFIKDDPLFYIRDQEGSLLGGIDFLGTFSDYLINKDESYQLKIRIPEYYILQTDPGQHRILYFYLLNLTKDYFDYIRSRVVAEYNYDLPIVDPIKIHSNISEGRGLIGGISIAKDSLIFDKSNLD